jgi:Immunoglobulin-like domain of bacterial spore germination
MSKRVPLMIAALCVTAAGCGSSQDATTTAATTTASSTSTRSTTTAPSPISVTVFRVRDGRLYADAERVQGTRAVAAASLEALGLASPVSIADGTAQVDRTDATPEQIAEIVYTLTQYPSVQRVDVAGRTGLTRADIAEFVPPILIERPAAGATTGETIHVIGSASVFEATVVLELRRNGTLVQKKVVTAAEGAPGRGPFTGTLVAPDGGRYVVAAYSQSAADGSRQHEQDVPVTVTP